MRTFAPRPTLSATASAKLSTKTAQILAAADLKLTATAVYSAARSTKWFGKSVIAELGKLVGKGERCMYCGGSEASQVEHFQPKDTFPELAMTWENFIWVCGVCNQNKNNSFPCDAAGLPLLINPIDEDVWQYFDLDKFGNFVAKWDIAANNFDVKARATELCIKLNRQAAQEARFARFKQLEKTYQQLVDSVKLGHANKKQLEEQFAEDAKFPFHPEVAQYFLIGRGANEEPFLSARALTA